MSRLHEDNREAEEVPTKKLRVYTDDTPEAVRELYKTMRTKQTYDYVSKLSKKYNKLERPMKVWDAVELMETFIDVSDPDVNLPQIVHLLQTAESIRKSGLPDWFQLVGFIHDLGKMIYLKGNDDDGTSMKEQFSIVGDTFVVGIPFTNTMIFPEFNSLNPDSQLDLYPDKIGLSNVKIAYGHDEYLYQVLKQNNQVTIPEEGLYAIRFHSLYPWHREGEYSRLESEYDIKMKPWVKLLNEHDLYTKENVNYSQGELDRLIPYYKNLINKYLPEELLW
jgi:inositol oxygenase